MMLVLFLMVSSDIVKLLSYSLQSKDSNIPMARKSQISSPSTNTLKPFSWPLIRALLPLLSYCIFSGL